MALDEEDLPRLVAVLAVTLGVHDVVELRTGVDIGLEPATANDRLGDRTGRLPSGNHDDRTAPLVVLLARCRSVPLARTVVRLGKRVDVTERDSELLACRLRNRSGERDVEVTLRQRSLDGRVVDDPDAVLGRRRVRRVLGRAGAGDESQRSECEGCECGECRGAVAHVALFSY